MLVYFLLTKFYQKNATLLCLAGETSTHCDKYKSKSIKQTQVDAYQFKKYIYL